MSTAFAEIESRRGCEYSPAPLSLLRQQVHPVIAFTIRGGRILEIDILEAGEKPRKLA